MKPRLASMNRGVVLAFESGPILLFVAAATFKASWVATSLAAGGTLALLMILVVDVALLLTLPLLFLARGVRLVATIVLNVAVTTFVLADLVHIRMFGDAMALTELSYAHQLLEVLPSVRSLLRPLDAVYYLDVVIAVVALPWYLRHARNIPPAAVRLRFLGAMAVLCVGLPVLRPVLHALASDVELYTSLVRHVSPEPAAETIGVPQLARVTRLLQDRQLRRGHRSPLFGAAAGANVILLSAESLSRFPIGLEIGGQAITPNLSAFAREALDFTEFFDQTSNGGTSDAELLALQSLHPIRSGSVSFRYPSTAYRGLPAILGEHGYTVVSMCGAAGTFWNMATTHRRFGFQRSFFESDLRGGERLNGWLADGAFFPQVVGLVERLSRPFFAFLMSSSNHHPFDMPPAHRSLNLGALEETDVGKYLHSVHYFDAAFGEFVEQLRATGLLERTLIVVYGDHKGYIGDGAALLRLVNFEARQERDVWLLNKRVPLLIRLPRGSRSGNIAVPGGHLDIAPTILALLGLEGQDRLMLGWDLTGRPAGPVVFRDGSFVDREHKSMVRRPRPVCFDQAGLALTCSALNEARNEALDQLQTSDFIIQGNLIPTLSANAHDDLRRPGR